MDMEHAVDVAMDMEHADICEVDGWIIDPDSISAETTVGNDPFPALVNYTSFTTGFDAKLYGGKTCMPEVRDLPVDGLREASMQQTTDITLREEDDEVEILTPQAEKNGLGHDGQDIKECSFGKDEDMAMQETTNDANGHLVDGSIEPPTLLQSTSKELSSCLQGTMYEQNRVQPDGQDMKECSLAKHEDMATQEATVVANGHLIDETVELPKLLQNTSEGVITKEFSSLEGTMAGQYEKNRIELDGQERKESSFGKNDDMVMQLTTGAVNPHFIDETMRPPSSISGASAELFTKEIDLQEIIPVEDERNRSGPDGQKIQESNFGKDRDVLMQVATDLRLTDEIIEPPTLLNINISGGLLTKQTSYQGAMDFVEKQEEYNSESLNRRQKEGGTFTGSSSSTESSEDSESSDESTEDSESEEENSVDTSKSEIFQKEESEKESGELTAGEEDADGINQADTISMKEDRPTENGKVKAYIAKKAEKKHSMWEYESGSEEDRSKGPIRSTNQLEVLPQVPSVEVKLRPGHVLLPAGVISAVLGTSVVVEGIEGQNALNEGSILWMTNDKLPLGIVDEVFGPVKKPFYVVRYNVASDVPAGARTQASVAYVSEFVSFVLKNDPSLYEKGYDGSDLNDQELVDTEAEFSDDEKEAEYRRLKTQKKRANMDKGWDDKFQTDQKRGYGIHFQNRRNNGNHMSDFNQGQNGCRKMNNNFRNSNIFQPHTSSRGAPRQQMRGRKFASRFSGRSLEQQRFQKWQTEVGDSSELLFRHHSEERSLVALDNANLGIGQELETSSLQALQKSATLHPEASSCTTQHDQQKRPPDETRLLSGFPDQKPKFQLCKSPQRSHQKIPENLPEVMFNVSSEGYVQQQSVEEFQRKEDTHSEDLPFRSIPQELSLEQSNIRFSDIQSQLLKQTAGKREKERNHTDPCSWSGPMHSEGISYSRNSNLSQKCTPQGAQVQLLSERTVHQSSTSYARGPMHQRFEKLHLVGSSGQNLPYRPLLHEHRGGRMVSDRQRWNSKKFMQSPREDHGNLYSDAGEKGQHTARHLEDSSNNFGETGSWIPDHQLHNGEPLLVSPPMPQVKFSAEVGTPPFAWGSVAHLPPQPAFQVAPQLPVAASFPQHLGQPFQGVAVSSMSQAPQIAPSHGPGFQDASLFPAPVLGVPVNPSVMFNSMHPPQMPFWSPTQSIAPGQPPLTHRPPHFPTEQPAEWQNHQMKQMPYNFYQGTRYPPPRGG